jgi:transaldolase / glucose-6-phosphate isomerase
MPCRAQQLLDLGQSVWLDYIHRRELRSGLFAAQVREQGVVGVTSNPTIFQQAIGQGTDYDDAIRERLALPRPLAGVPLYESLAIEDVQEACDALQDVFERSGGLDGRVSIEVNPRLAHDTAGTVAEARRLRQQVARANVMIKVPATAAGLPAVRTLIAEGVCVNVTLIFSLARYEQVMEAYLAGLEDRAARGEPLAPVVSVASFFVSRVDSKVDAAIERRLAALPVGAPERAELLEMPGRAAVANARIAYGRFREVVATPRFAALAARGARVQRPLWASTSTKNSAYPDTLYVDELIGPDTVNTIPPKTLAAYNDHGVLDPRLLRGGDEARALFRRLPELGVPVDALIGELEEEGVTAFVKSFESLLATLEEKRARMAG